MTLPTSDEIFMHRTLQLARHGEGLVSPNPMAGAILVRGGIILGEAFHRQFGAAHAEQALVHDMRARKIQMAGATLYVNLEPCVEYSGKKTPACASSLLDYKIRRVVIACTDPNPKISGRGINVLRKAGIQVEVGCLKDEAEKLNKKFFTWMRTGRPFVCMKVAMSLDGKIATKTGDSKWITSEASRAWVHELRDSYDAILVGIGTVARDNPQLAGKKRKPMRIILDSTLRLSPKAKVLRDSNVILVTTTRAPRNKIQYFQKRGIVCKIFPRKISIPPLLRFLAQKGVSSVLVEGGSEIFGSFVDKKMVDRFYWFIAPKIIGGKNAKPAIGGEGVLKVARSLQLKNWSVSEIGTDLLIEASY